MKDLMDIPQMPLRPPSEVMRLARMGSMFPTRLSFLRVLMRRLAAEKVQITRRVWQMCDKGLGHGVYTLRLGGHDYSLVAVSSDLPEDQRTDRVIATAWDSAYVLYDGIPSRDEIARICATAPKQEAARFSARDLILSRANKSVRLFAHVVEALRAGRQPDSQMIQDVGYLMRTTAVYGNGKFGIADRGAIAARPGLEGPFAAEMLTVWMIRHFTHDLVEHIGGAPLESALKRHLGVGNATGLGMAPFLVNHPVLLNNWMQARETAIARVRALKTLTPAQKNRLRALRARVTHHLRDWNVADAAHQGRIENLRADWAATAFDLDVPHPLDAAMNKVKSASGDLQELTAALILEPFPDLVDDLAQHMGDPHGAMTLPLAGTHALRLEIESHFAWALALDYAAEKECGQFWYVSEAKQEPRLGRRFEEPGAEIESPLDIARRIHALHAALPKDDRSLPAFLADHPQHALAAERVQLASTHPYGEIHDNLIADSCLPIDMLRCKLSFFGASKFDPKSDRWTRITLCQGAPLASDLTSDLGGDPAGDVDDWWLPVFTA